MTRACALLSFLAVTEVRADFIQNVTANQNLAAAATEIKNTVNTGTHVVQFSAYNTVGRFKLESPSAKVDTLVFERNASLQSDSAVRISGDTALLEIKNMRNGTVVLRGLAFHLATPDARLLAGAEPGKENAHLIIDSCFVFGDNNASSFLTWLGAAGSKIEIRRSFFVFKTGNAQQSKAILTATTATFANNLLHFGGQVSATMLSGGLFDFRSNTVVRTQLKIASESFQGARYEVTRNFIAHRGTQDAFGGADIYHFWAANFHPIESLVRHNRILRNWKGFDHPGTNPPLFAGDPTNQVRDTVETAKAGTELWNWYSPLGASDSTGHGFGRDKRGAPYDIFPGDSAAPFIFEVNSGKVHFRPALFPRQLKAVRTPMAVPAGFDSLRFHSPVKGALHFGPFKVDSIVLGMATGFGRAQLLSSDSTYQFKPQRIVGDFRAPSQVFPNDFPPARYYFIAFKGNTPKGSWVGPDRASSSLAGGDTLAFGAVDSAGFTEIYEEALTVPYPDFLRNLGRNFAMRTSAALSGSLVFGSTEGVKPHWSDQVYWWHPKDSSLLKASPAAGGRHIVTIPANPRFSAYLVEKLNVKRGGTTIFPLARQGEVRATSAAGYQLAIDSLFLPDTLRFGQASRGYSLAFTGRQGGDSLVLKLPGGPDTEVFRVAGDLFPAAPSTVDSQGFHSVHIAPGDSNVRLFSGIRYNVIANVPFPETDTLAGVRISGLLSTRSGKITILPFNESLLQVGIGTKDTLPSNGKFLGGKGIRTLSLSLPDPWSATFVVSKTGDPSRVVAYAWNGQRWRPLPNPTFAPGDSVQPTVSGLLESDQAIAVLELLKPASEYVDMVPVIGDRTLSVKVTNINAVNQPIKSFTLRVIHVNAFGDVDTLTVGPVPVGQTAFQSLTNRSGLFAYAVQYHTAEGKYGSATFTPITQFSWNTADMSVGPMPVKPGRQWHLLGSPYLSSWANSFVHQGRDTTTKDTTDVLKLKSVAGAAAWDPVPSKDTLKLQPGDAILFNSGDGFKHKVDPGAPFILTGEHSLGPHAGWRFVSPPYPMTFRASAVRTNNRTVGRFLELRMQSFAQPVDGKAREYSWHATDVLKAFTGYAYEFAEGEVLTFNPWSSLAPPALPKGAAAPTPLGSVEVRLEAGGRARSMRLVSGPGVREMRYLPAPGGGLELRVGGQGGWFEKKVEDLLGIDEPIIIRSPARYLGRLGLGLEGLPALRKDWRARLIHLSTGEIRDLSGINLDKGEQEYRLVAGTEAFVAERVSAFKKGLPAGLILSQNFPNPFRALTRIAVDWPALAGPVSGPVRQARLEVFDARGRRVYSQGLGPIRVGRQVVTVDASRWEPGLYTYRLTVATGGSRGHLQKRMLVSP